MKVGATLQFSQGKHNVIKVTNLGEIESNEISTTRKLKISFSKKADRSNQYVKSHTFTHIHIHDWEDMSTPNHPNQLIRLRETFMNQVKEIKRYNKGIPVVVQSSTGNGRTGTFEALYFLNE